NVNYSSPPRAVTPRAARRSWGELPVRFWWMCAAALAVVMLVFAILRILEAQRDRDLVKHGVEVQARILTINGGGGMVLRMSKVKVKLRGRMPDGREVDFVD